MFVLAVKFKATRGREEELERLLRRALAEVRQEPDTLMYDLHRKTDDPSELFLYERYTDRAAWKITHMSRPYIKALLAALPDHLETEAEVTAYETVEVK